MDKDQLKRIEKIVSRYRVTDGSRFRLKDVDPGDTAGLRLDEDERRQLLADSTEWLSDEQDRLYAQDRWSVLMILQAMDAAGKDGTIRHVFSGVNPQGCEIHSFKAPNPTELDHDFLWRHMNTLPSRGCIGIHNRSWYEEVLVVRVHPEFLDAQKLPEEVRSKRIFDERLEDIAAIERYLARQGTAILKVFLHVSREEQKKRFLARIDEPDRNWKFSAADVAERQHWEQYMDAYERAIRATAAPHAPWYVVPADNKWFTRLVVAGAMIVTMDALDLDYPKLPRAERARLADAKRQLLGEQKK